MINSVNFGKIFSPLKTGFGFVTMTLEDPLKSDFHRKIEEENGIARSIELIDAMLNK